MPGSGNFKNFVSFCTLSGLLFNNLNVELVRFISIKILLVFFVITAFLISCIDDDATDISPTIEYEAEFSLPVGTDTITLAQLLYNVPLIKIDEPFDKDTVSYFFYDSVYYYSPGTLKDSVSAPLILAPFENDTAEITTLMFRINAANFIPAKFMVQVYFADSNKVILDSLYEDGPVFLESAYTNDIGIVIGPWETIIDNYLPSEKIDKLNDMTDVILSTKMTIPDSSADTVPVPFYHDQSLWIQVGIRVGLKMTVNVF